MDWSHDYCLGCEKQTYDGEVYCCQSCRLADIEQGRFPDGSATAHAIFAPHPPTRANTLPAGPAASSWQPTSSALLGSGLNVPAEVDLSAYKSALPSPLAHPHPHATAQSHASSPSKHPHQPLSPSSSRSSLASMAQHVHLFASRSK